MGRRLAPLLSAHHPTGPLCFSRLLRVDLLSVPRTFYVHLPRIPPVSPSLPCVARKLTTSNRTRTTLRPLRVICRTSHAQLPGISRVSRSLHRVTRELTPYNYARTMPISMREQLRVQSGSYSPRLLAVLFGVFNPTAGPTLAHQVPEGSVATALSTFPTQSIPAVPVPVVLEETTGMVRSTSGQGLSSTQVLFDFSSILDFVIPKPELCGHLITKATRTCKILGFPVR